MTAPLRNAEAAFACAACRGRDSGVCGSLSESALGRIWSLAQSVSLPANARVCDAERGCSHFHLVQSGYLRMQSHSMAGRRQILGMARPGESIGPPRGGIGVYEVEAATPVRLCRFDRQTFELLLFDEPELRRALFQQSQIWLEKTRRLTWLLGALGSNARLRAILLLARDWLPWRPLEDGTGVLSLELPRQDIADYLATTQETVSRLLHQFQDEGLIEIINPRKIRLIDFERLAEGLDGLASA
ncbi:Crp/Fnr family transcriptional regulator [Thioclava sp. L04-15]|uniref:Crp/Fnr family transcriptional regulator n=1 Tax=Thioclava sp. L04-15 TaxID=1915318 RepID=UPI0009972C2F|nr:Crp/Fnr family transcriptional regulator [Thioclava sp. L04-15]TNE83603.1 MAG: Crp/Fnr family transcriptional regulator [Paracoccaceae bacterium]